MVIENRTPGDKGEVSAAFDEGGFAGGEGDDAAEGALYRFAGASPCVGEAEVAGKLAGDAGQLAPLQGCQQVGARDEAALVLLRQTLLDEPLAAALHGLAGFAPKAGVAGQLRAS